jgi:hypothetical protein
MGISVDVVCNDSTKGRRAVTTRMKNQVYTDYAVASHATGAYEIDHFIPLERGGQQRYRESVASTRPSGA